jgi:hypothetical protein
MEGGEPMTWTCARCGSGAVPPGKKGRLWEAKLRGGARTLDGESHPRHDFQPNDTP